MSVTVTVAGKSGTNVTATSGDVVNVTLSPTGTPGGVGPQGPAGPATSLSIGTVTSGASASATITGTAPSQTLSLVLPKGDKGDTGSQGSKGDAGPAGPANSLTIGTVSSGTAAATITGSAPSQVLNLTLPAGPKGDTGSTGPAGPANTLSIGTVNSGSTPSATITGTSPNQILNLVLARGDAGATGATGAAGPANSLTIGSVTDGVSAGASITGTAPTQTLNLTLPYIGLAIGTVTSGSPAAATITGTGLSRVLNLTLPQGDKGDTGATDPSYTLPTATSSVLGGVKVGTGLAISDGVLSATGGGGSLSWASVPASSSASGTAGDLAYDSSRLYICTATNTWKAAALSRWDGDPLFSSVSLLMHMEGSGASFTDLSSNAFTVTATGDATQSTTQAKFGSKSASFSAGQIYLPADNAFNFGSGDFCIEFFAFLSSIAADQRLAGGDGRSTSGNFNWGVYTNFSGQLGLYLSSGGSTWDIAAGASFGSVTTSQWYHVAIARSGGTIRAYLNGTRGSSTSTTASLYSNTSNGPFFGRQSTSTFTGFIDAIRITKGSDRGYTGATITVPTAAFPDF